MAEIDLEHAARIALASMMSTAHANLSVGPPYDLAIYRDGSFSLEELRMDVDSPYLDELRTTWQRLQLAAIDALPPLSRDQA